MSQHWASLNERGHPVFLQLTRWMVRYFPLWLMKFVTFWVVLYFFVTSKTARGHIRTYQTHLTHTFPNVQLGRFALLRQFFAFGESICDRFAVWQHKIGYADLVIEDPEQLYQEMNDPNARGQILVCSHFGNTEVSRALVANGHHAHFKLHILVHSKHAQAFNQALVDAGADELSLIQVSELDAAKMWELSQYIERGEWIALAVDRIPLQGDKTAAVNFLGQPALFPQGAWLLASLLKTSVNTLFCVKQQGKYHLSLHKLDIQLNGRSTKRQQQIQHAMQHYADLLAQQCAKNPLQWFNFYDFWADEPHNQSIMDSN
ncbi:LpxL/LpxP family acyltransferase [Lonepinella sp. BR2357]|uniref:LpxL/LpxP family acyltransferase n=1 Tax=Lonepinella sp. BR2357 TaxID=3434549 RepID=UPI003F6DCE9D